MRVHRCNDHALLLVVVRSDWDFSARRWTTLRNGSSRFNERREMPRRLRIIVAHATSVNPRIIDCRRSPSETAPRERSFRERCEILSFPFVSDCNTKLCFYYLRSLSRACVIAHRLVSHEDRENNNKRKSFVWQRENLPRLIEPPLLARTLDRLSGSEIAIDEENVRFLDVATMDVEFAPLGRQAPSQEFASLAEISGRQRDAT